MVNFATLKKSGTDISRLTKEIEKINSGGSSNQDDRFWYPELDKSENGYAVIRFLPAPEVDGEDALPWVRVWRHSFKGPSGLWYIENSLTTLNQKDPVTEFNSALWNSTEDDNSPERKQVRAQKRQLQYIANIMVVSDPKNPQNEGKVFLFRFGKKIFDKIKDVMNPEFEGEEAMNPFDFWTGANFKLKIRKFEGYRNYDKSEFDVASALSEDDAVLEKIWKSEYSLKEFVSPSQFKSYDELEKRLREVLLLDKADEAASRSYDEPTPPVKPAAKPAESKASAPWDSDDDDLSEFEELAKD